MPTIRLTSVVTCDWAIDKWVATDPIRALLVGNAEKHGELGACQIQRFPERFPADLQPGKRRVHQINNRTETGIAAFVE